MGMRPSTFSIVAFDPVQQQLGIAVQSKFLAVGSVVPWAKAGVGAVATQSWANTAFGPAGLDLLSRGATPQEALDDLLEADPERDSRQVGIVDAEGRAATFTGSACFAWAGGRTGEHYACQGNILVGPETVDAMAAHYEATAGQELAFRLVGAIQAAQAAGGDSRGQQSAAVVVVQEGAGYGGFNDRYLDLRVDDHPAPIDELHRLLTLHVLYYPRPDEPMLELTEVAPQLGTDLAALGYLDGPAADTNAVTDALRRFSMRENLEERLRDDGRVFQVVAEYIQGRAAETR